MAAMAVDGWKADDSLALFEKPSSSSSWQANQQLLISVPLPLVEYLLNLSRGYEF